ncbi:MAG: YlbF family regulator [Bacilli bacterium]|nr:YlbF family regulator [Bacilli bacterium]
MEELNKSLDEVVNVIKNSKEYKMCISLKQQMDSNSEISSLVKEIKLKQKKYIRENNSNILSELKEKEEKLNSIPIYHIYLENLEKVNYMINYVKEELNDYFDNLLNKKY